MEQIQSVLVEPAKTVGVQIGQFLLNMVTVLFILLIGWLISKLIKALVVWICRLLKVDDLSERIELSKLLKKGGISTRLSDLIGLIFYWLGILITLVVSVNAIGVSIASDPLEPHCNVCAQYNRGNFILIIGMFHRNVIAQCSKTGSH